ncbi:MAG TPA: immune inhibitor A domain-containing protein, partial [Candidatus Edwardsbacteria bacterium]|nr:immune inhibitor A domain-containing protein [Candidatus Edwardsbacteria bacterium]
MKRTLTVIAIAALLAIMAGAAWAVPAKPGPRVLSQPDGSTFIGKLIGDEHFSFAETMDGNSIIRNSDGWWTYARQEGGLLVAGDVIVGRGECPYAAHLRPNAAAVAKIPGNEHKEINRTAAERAETAVEFFYGKGGTAQHPKSAPSGRQYVNVVLGDFTDSTFLWYANTERNGQNPYGPFPYSPAGAGSDSAFTENHFWGLAFGDSVGHVPDSSKVPSLTNFYWDMTYHKCLWYGGVAMGSSNIKRASAVSGQSPTTAYLQATVTACDSRINYYTGGSVNNLMVVHPGPGQEESADTKDIWSMSITGITLTSGEGNITKCIAVPQNAQLGVFCHELFHQSTGGPDLYDYGYSSNPWGPWSLMDEGSWNGLVNGGDAPAFIGGHLAYTCTGVITDGSGGWLTQTDSISSAKNGDGRYTICALDSAGAARGGNITNGIRLWRIRNNNFRDSAQTFFVELRQRNPPYEIGLPEDGLIISHLDTRMSSTHLNDGPPGTRAFYSWVECPGFDPNPCYASGDSILPGLKENACYSADDVSPGGYLENRIDSTSVPNSWINKCYSGTPARTGPWIYDVSREGPVMTFSVLRTGMTATSPLVSFQTATVLDPVTANTANNNNGLLDPWETDSLKITFLNSGAAVTAGAQCSLYVVQNGQYISFTPGWQSVGGGAIGSGATATNVPFVVTVSQNAPRFLDIGFAVKFKSTTPAVTDTSYFTLRISPFKIAFTYDFANLFAGGTDYRFRIQPSDLAVYQDTLFVANANLNNATFQTRIYKVKKNTTNNPLVGGVGGDTISSLNNRGTVQDAAKYLGGIDIANDGTLWWSVQDSCFNCTRAGAVQRKFLMPNVSWGG